MRNTIVIGHKQPDTDSICSAIALARFLGKGYQPARAGEIHEETKFILDKWNASAPPLIQEIEKGQQVILVDHSEKEQRVKGATIDNIVQIVDHHPLTDLTPEAPIDMDIKQWGATATIITHDFYLLKNHSLDQQTAGLLLSAILSDTLVLRNPTATVHDQEMVRKLAPVAKIRDWGKYGYHLLQIRTDHNNESIRQVIMKDYKEYQTDGVKMGIAQVLTPNWRRMASRKGSFLKQMTQMKEDRNLELIIVLLTDFLEKESLAWVVGSSTGEKVFEKTFQQKLDQNEALLNKVMVRKTQVVAPLRKSCRLLS